MKAAVVFMALLVALQGCSAVAGKTGSRTTPIEKVIELMNGMLAKGKEEKHNEQVQYAAYKQFCDDTSNQKGRAIKDADEQIMKLQADIEKFTAEIELLSKEIAEHEDDVAVWTGDMKAATKVREIEKGDYDVTHKDYTETIDAIKRAKKVLEEKQGDTAQAAAFDQVRAVGQRTSFSPAARQAIQAFLEEDQEPAAAGYESQSGGIVDMLEKLKDKFIAERTTLEQEERASKQAYEMLTQELNNGIEKATTNKDQKSEQKSTLTENKATAEGDLADTTATRAEDQKYLDDLTATCEQKAADFEARQQLRAEELVAIEKAIEIISSQAVSGAAFYQERGGVAFAQARSEEQLGVARSRATAFLQARANKLQSRLLEALAVRMSVPAGADPFVKLRKMIKDLIVRLMEEADAEASQKGWCDNELATNEQTRQEKTVAVESLKATIDELEASIAKNTEELVELSSALSDLESAMTEATKLRGNEKEKNTQTVADAQEAQTAVAQAMTVLKEFYSKAAGATALIQRRQEPPASFDAPYQGMGGESGGVVGMLEVIQSDFARLEAETTASEEASQKEYDAFMTESKVDKESKSTDVKHKEAKKQDENQALTIAKRDQEAEQKELSAALRYFDKLKPTCVDSGVSYEDRVARRKEEIESLQEALQILEGKEIV